MVMSSLSMGGPIKLFSKRGTLCTWELMENNPHGMVLYTFMLLAIETAWVHVCQMVEQ